MKKIKLLSILFLAYLTGCGLIPQIDCNRVSSLKSGMSEKDVINIMGEPYFSSITIKNRKIDEKIIDWQDKESPTSSNNLLRVRLSPEGRVINYYGKCAGHNINSQ